MSRPRQRRAPAVLVGMGETAGYCSQLVEGFREIGIRADHLDLGPDRHGYARRRPRLAVRLVRRLARLRSAGPGPRAVWTALHRLGMAYLFLESVVRYDAFVLRAGDSFFALRDLPLLRRLGKRVVVVFFGTDSRPSYMSGAVVARGIVGAEAARVTAIKRAQVERIERSATEIVCHVMTAQLHSRPAVAFLAIGIPRRLPPAASAAGPGDRRAIRVLHAPSDPSGKGTAAISEAVALVRGRGIDLELTVAMGRPNREVLEAIWSCDFVVDQVYSDTPMAALAAEAAARGRAALVAGYGWSELLRLTPGEILPPTCLAHPDELADALARLATDHAYRLEIGARARAFLEQRWAPASVAERMLAVIQGRIPEDWRFDPRDPVYPYGAGISLDALRRSVRSVIEARGIAGLRVADKPELERRLVSIAAETAGTGATR
jgi:glycosyltransferase involved in cell wall biosynthesis